MLTRLQKEGSHLSDANLPDGLLNRDLLGTAESVNGYIHIRKDDFDGFPQDLNGWLSVNMRCTILGMLHCFAIDRFTD